MSQDKDKFFRESDHYLKQIQEGFATLEKNILSKCPVWVVYFFFNKVLKDIETEYPEISLHFEETLKKSRDWPTC